MKIKSLDMETAPALKEKNANRLINIVSVGIPIIVAIMLSVRQKIYLGNWTYVLPHLNGIINTVTSLLLLLGLYFIRQKNVIAHKRIMLTAFTLGFLFLISYVLYHLSNESTPYGGQGWIRPVYYFLLISHIVLSIVVLWFVLRAVYFALTKHYGAHRRIVRWAYPIWLYVSITGVIVYLMVSPYYKH